MSSSPITIVPVPFDRHSSYLQGAAAGAAGIRAALFCDSSNLWTENGIDLGTRQGSDWKFVAEVEIEGKPFLDITRNIDRLLAEDRRLIILGGDHSITYPVLRAYGKRFDRLNLLHFDAHPDLYDELDGNRWSHACPFARIMESGLAVRLVQAGIRTMTGHQREQAERFGVEVIEMNRIDQAAQLHFDGPLYVSIDLDCLDPAFAPGVSHHEPGGMSTRDLLRILQGVRGEIVGCDIVEYNPERDIHQMTGMVAAKLLKEMMGRMLGQSSMPVRDGD